MNEEGKRQKIGSILFKYRKGITKNNIESITRELLEIV